MTAAQISTVAILPDALAGLSSAMTVAFPARLEALLIAAGPTSIAIYRQGPARWFSLFSISSITRLISYTSVSIDAVVVVDVLDEVELDAVLVVVVVVVELVVLIARAPTLCSFSPISPAAAP